MREPIGGPERPPSGLEWLIEPPRSDRMGRDEAGWQPRPAPILAGCQHGEHSIACISTATLIGIVGPVRMLQCRVCGVRWGEVGA